MSGQVKRGPSVTLVPAGRSSGVFKDVKDLLEKVMNLENIPGLYEKCLQKQNEIIEKYMNMECLKNYILSIIK